MNCWHSTGCCFRGMQCTYVLACITGSRAEIITEGPGICGATDQLTQDHGCVSLYSHRDLALIFGGLMQLSVLLPTLRHFRIINILGLIGTTLTAW